MIKNTVGNRIRVDKKDIVWFFILICYFESPYLSRFTVMDTVYTVAKVLSFGFVVVHLRDIYFNSIMALIILIELSLWVSTFIAGSSMISVTIQFVSVTSFIIIISIMLKKDAARCIRVLYRIMALLIYINVISMLLFPDGLYTATGVVGTKKYYFLGHQNSLGLYATIAIVLGEFRLQTEKKEKFRLRNLVILEVISLFYIIRVWSVISFISVAGIIAITFYNRMSKKGWRISLVWSLCMNIVIFVLFVIMQNLQIFSTFLQKFLNREMTLSGRTQVWAIAFSSFLQNPIWGVGQGKGYEMFGFATTHNRYLNTMFTGGLVGFILFNALLILTCRKLKFSKETMTQILIAYFTVLFVIIQGETFDDILFFLLFIFVGSIQYLRQATIREINRCSVRTNDLHLSLIHI